MAKSKDMQPWLDYFEMLHAYENNGFLQVEEGKHEAYITQTALPSLSGFDTADDIFRQCMSLGKVVRHLRTYAGWKSTEGKEYLNRSFAVHVVQDNEPHDLICTVLLRRRRRWWSLWLRRDSFEVVEYEPKKTEP